MRASCWLVLELEETRYTSGHINRTLKIVKTRQTQPLDQLAVHVTLDIPDEVLMPKVEALIDHTSQINLTLSPPEEVFDAATS